VPNAIGGNLGCIGIYDCSLLGPWPHNAHLAAKHIDQLWQLVHAESSEKPANASGCAADSAPIALFALGHGPQLENPECPPAKPDPVLGVEDSTSIIQFDRSSRRQHDCRSDRRHQ